MNAITLLRQLHRRLGALIRRVSDEQDARLPLVLQLVEELMTHLSIEDHFFLCRVAESTNIRVDAYRREQADVRNAILQAVFVEDDDAAFSARLHELRAAYERYARVIERDLLPLVEAQVRADDLESLGARMESYWHAAVTPGRASAGQVHAAE
jgi:hypothetical protein